MASMSTQGGSTSSPPSSSSSTSQWKYKVFLSLEKFLLQSVLIQLQIVCDPCPFVIKSVGPFNKNNITFYEL